MQNLVKLRNLLCDNVKVIVFLICLPFGTYLLNLVLNMFFNLGIYTGTFLRFLYDIVVY